MGDKTLRFTAVQPGFSKQIDFPLHELTADSTHVGGVLEAVLAAVSGQIQARERVSDGDVLQALCMAIAIRMHMVQAPIGSVQHLVAGLLDAADDAVADGVLQPAGKA